jgi:hypothetical protein
MLLHRGRPRDRERAHELLARTLEAGSELGMSALESRATTLARDATSAPISAKASEPIAR